MTPPILVTGAASGLGLATARLLRERGHDVILSDLRPSPLGETRLADLTDEAARRDLIAGLPPLGGLVASAGVAGQAPGHLVMELNYVATRDLVSRLLPKMARGSAAVVLSSTSALFASQTQEERRAIRDDPAAARPGWQDLEGWDAYGLSKRLLLDELPGWVAAGLPHGVRVNALLPGPIETPMLGDLERMQGAEAMDYMKAVVGRHGQPREIATIIAFLLSPDASWLNGVELRVDGGLFTQFALEQRTS